MIKVLDTVALLVDVPEKHLLRGQVGTVVEVLAEGVLEVEFSDDEGRAYVLLPLHENQLITLRYELVA
jgi:hypothetical protein